MTSTPAFMNEPQARDEICRVGRSLFERGYVHATAGNISVRLDDGFLITPTDASARPRASGQVEVGEVVLSGRYVAKSDMALDVDGGALSTTTGGRLTSAPHRLVQADQPASVSRRFTDAMAVPPMAQIEVRRVTADEDSRLCAGHPVGWLALAVRRDGFVLMPVRQGPPPGGAHKPSEARPWCLASSPARWP